MLKSYSNQGRRNELIKQESTTIFLAHSNAHTIVVSLLVILFTLVSNLNIIACSTRFHDAHGAGKHHGHHHHHGSSHERRHQRSVNLALDQSLEQAARFNSSSSWLHQRDQAPVLDQCCACDEAKYEMVFEGLWSKYTHPDDFPENYWLAYFGDIIGASHSNDFRMWAEGALASEGVRELAQTGATKKLESELKQVSSKTRTIIKARELRYPTLNSKTSAVFRTDRHHHLVSILSKLGPSPDWMVGVSGLELCQADCSWASQRSVNLFLWDAGTDSGDTFTAPDSPVRPQERIRPYRRASAAQLSSQTNATLRSLSLIDASLGNYNQAAGVIEQSGGGLLDSAADQSALQTSDEFGRANNQVAPPVSTYYTGREQTKPFARLTITRQRIYEKSCNAVDTLSAFPNPRSTFTNQANQQQQQQQQKHSYANQHHNMRSSSQPDAIAYEPIKPPASYLDCRFTEWSDWSSCSSICGKGIRTRTRSHIDDQAELAGCSKADLIEKEICLSECLANGTTCVTRDWSQWSKCSVDCGQGYRKRTRSPIGPMRPACNQIELAESEQCTGTCGQEEAAPPHCAVSEWSEWSECPVACGTGTKIRFRQLLRKEDAKNCNVKLIQKQSCTGRPELCKQLSKDTPSMQDSPGVRDTNAGQVTKINPNLPVIDCKLSNWSPWSTCSAMCGNGRRTRSRYIIQMPQNGGKPCDRKLSRMQRCKELPPCPQDFNLPEESSSKFIKHNFAASGRQNQNHHHHHHKSTQTSRDDFHRATTTTTTQGSSMMDDEDESKFSRLLKSELGHLHLAGWSSTESHVSDGLVAPTEMELIGSSNFQIKNGFIYPFIGQDRKQLA